MSNKSINEDFNKFWIYVEEVRENKDDDLSVMKWVEDESLEDLWAEEDIYDSYDVSKELNIHMITLNEDEVEKLKYDSLRIRKNNTKTNIESYIL